MKTGIYGGSFDPPHLGHLKLASFAKNTLGLDRLIIIPAWVSPFKTGGTDAGTRLELCRMTFGDGFEVSDIEIKRGTVSYTADTVEELKKLYPGDDFFLLIGSDQLIKFKMWRRWRDIISSVTLCAAARSTEDDVGILQSCADDILFSGGKVILLDFEPLEISSTEIRRMIKENEDVSRYLDGKTADYIKSGGLYLDQ